MLKFSRNILLSAACLLLVLVLFDQSSISVESKRLSKLNKNDNEKDYFNYEDEHEAKVESVVDDSEAGDEEHDVTKSELLEQQPADKKSELLENAEKDEQLEDNNENEDDVQAANSRDEKVEDKENVKSNSTSTGDKLEIEEKADEKEDEDAASDDEDEDDDDDDDDNGDDELLDESEDISSENKEIDNINVQKPSNIKENSHIHQTSEKTEKINHSSDNKNKFNLLYIVLPGAGFALLLLILAGFLIVKKTNLFKKKGPSNQSTSKQQPRSNNTVYQPVTQQV
jgi:hypothetical protein